MRLATAATQEPHIKHLFCRLAQICKKKSPSDKSKNTRNFQPQHAGLLSCSKNWVNWRVGLHIALVQPFIHMRLGSPYAPWTPNKTSGTRGELIFNSHWESTKQAAYTMDINAKNSSTDRNLTPPHLSPLSRFTIRLKSGTGSQFFEEASAGIDTPTVRYPNVGFLRVARWHCGAKLLCYGDMSVWRYTQLG